MFQCVNSQKDGDTLMHTALDLMDRIIFLIFLGLDEVITKDVILGRDRPKS